MTRIWPSVLRRGDAQAMSDLYERYGRLVFSVVLAIVRNGSVAEDITQDTFLRAWHRISDFHAGEEMLGRWLLTIARNRAIDHLRSSSFRADRNSPGWDVQEQDRLSLNMEREMVSADSARFVRGAVARLNPHQRQVIDLAYFEGLSQTEIADRLGQPLGTVKSWVRSALKHLREEFTVQPSAPSDPANRWLPLRRTVS